MSVLHSRLRPAAFGLMLGCAGLPAASAGINTAGIIACTLSPSCAVFPDTGGQVAEDGNYACAAPLSGIGDTVASAVSDTPLAAGR